MSDDWVDVPKQTNEEWEDVPKNHPVAQAPRAKASFDDEEWEDVPKNHPVAQAGAVQSAQPRENTTLAGLGGAFTRGASPVALGAGLGALVGALFAGVGAIPGAEVGAGAVAATDFALNAYNAAASHLGLPHAPTMQEASDHILDWLGVPKAETSTERDVQALSGGFAGGAGLARGAEQIAERAGPGVTKEVARLMGEGPAKQGVSGALGGAAAQMTAESGRGPVAQFVASTIGGGIPYAGRPWLATAKTSVTPSVEKSVRAGYVFPPAEIPKLGDHPSLPSAVASGEAGKIKLQQLASTKNQVNTNRLAAEGIGLPGTVMLTEEAFKQARAPADAVYERVRQAVPEVTFSDNFHAKAGNAGGRNSLVEQFFPSTAKDPAIEDLRAELQGKVGGLFTGHRAPTDAVMHYIADLRHSAEQNFKTQGDAGAHRLALAQREAANLVEDELERSVHAAPDYYSEKFNDALKTGVAAQKAFTTANNALTMAKANSLLAETSGSNERLASQATNILTGQNRAEPMPDVYAGQRAKEALNIAQKNFDKAQQDLSASEAEVENWRAKLKASYADRESNRTLADDFKSARRLYAKIYDVENATNKATGDVSALGLGRLYQKGAPLTDELKTIAEAALTAPKSMQVPGAFGHAEDWSALDFFGTALSLKHGNVPAALGIMGRPWVRGKLLSPTYQKAMIGDAPTGVPLPMIWQPGMQAVTPPQKKADAMLGGDPNPTATFIGGKQ